MLSRPAFYRTGLVLVIALACSLALSLTMLHKVQEQGAKDIWRKSSQQGARIPIRARVAVTLWKQGKTTATLARIAQGDRGRYCMMYEAPPEARGRIVCSDGRTNWQFEPKQNLVIKTPIDIQQQEREVTSLIEQNYRFKLITDQERAAGRPAYLLELVPVHAGKGKQRRWIDRQNYKTLRLETYFADGSLARTITYQQATFPAAIPDAELLPKFQKTARIVTRPGVANPTPAAHLAERARSLGLKAKGALGFQLKQATMSKVGKASRAHLLYTDGIETVSIFARVGGVAPPSASLKRWKRIALGKIMAYHQRQDHTDALVWTRAGHQYTAVSHLEPTALLAFVRGQLP